VALRRQPAKFDRKVGAVLDDELTQSLIRSRSGLQVSTTLIDEGSQKERPRAQRNARKPDALQYF